MSSVARITEISSLSSSSFDDAIKGAIERANQSLRNVTGAWIKEQKVNVENGQIKGYQVIMEITFILDNSNSQHMNDTNSQSQQTTSPDSDQQSAS